MPVPINLALVGEAFVFLVLLDGEMRLVWEIGRYEIRCLSNTLERCRHLARHRYAIRFIECVAPDVALTRADNVNGAIHLILRSMVYGRLIRPGISNPD